MKKLYTLAICVFPFVSGAQTCVLEATPELWDWTDYPIASFIDAGITHNNLAEMYPSIVDYGALFYLGFASENKPDTTYLYFDYESLSETATRIYGTFWPNGIQLFDCEFEVVARIDVFNEFGTEATIYSNFQTVQCPLLTSFTDPETIKFDVSPNPARDFVTISAQTSSVDIIDLTGRVVKAVPTNVQISVGDLPAGVYIAHSEGTRPKRIVIH